jgi:ribosome-binding protein aMBF1 (putative translation factor)
MQNTYIIAVMTVTFSRNAARTYSVKEVSPNFGPAAILKGARLRCGLTQNELAAEIGVKARLISEFERSKRPIDPDIAQKFSKIFNLSAKNFLTI